MKRGISPLIATVLIIGFTIALAAIIMTWGGGFVRTTTEKTEAGADAALKCATELDFEIKTVDPYAGTITIDNRGSVEIREVKFRLYAGDAISGTPVDSTIGVEPFAIVVFDSTNTPGLAFDVGVDKVDAIVTIDDGTAEGIVCGQSSRERSFEPKGE